MEAKVKKWMRANIESFRDGCGEINCTGLGEVAMQEFNIADDDENVDQFFEWAFEVFEEHEKRR